MMKRKYKALMLDLDGTTIPNDINGLPSRKVKKAIQEAQRSIHIGVATGRPFYKFEYLLTEFSFSGPSILHGGAHIIDLPSKKDYQQTKISGTDMKKIYEIAKKMDITLWIDNEYEASLATEENVNESKLGAIAFNFPTEKKADAFKNALSSIPGIASSKVVSWKKGCFDVGISHTSATKQHAIHEVAKILEIETHEIIGVGDGYNDFPLLMACGLKVAMGNAVDEIKAIADYIAPSVDEDGVVDIIEKFVL